MTTLAKFPKIRFRRRVGYFPRADDPIVSGASVVRNLVIDCEARHDNPADVREAKIELLTALCGHLFEALLSAEVLTLQQAHDIAGYGHTTTTWDDNNGS